MATITKRNMIQNVTDRLEKYTQQEVRDVLQCVLDEVSDRLASGDKVIFQNFGGFELRVAKPRVGRNPQKKGTEVQIPARAVVKFTPGQELKDRVAHLLPELLER